MREQLIELSKAQVMTGIGPQKKTGWKGDVVEAQQEQMERKEEEVKTISSLDHNGKCEITGR